MRALLVFLLPITAFGCGPTEVPRGIVSGNVKFDGKPVGHGAIRFHAVDGKSPTGGAAINDGQYRAEVPLGEVRVEITAPKVIGKKRMYDTPDGPWTDVAEELIPPHYNSASGLRITVRRGENKHDFDLKSR